MKRNILIGGAWPYANNSLHIGHIAGLIGGDIIARYYRGVGDNVVYVSGTDSHGTPITLRAKEEGIKPVELANRYHEEFVNTFKKINFSYDLYTTTDSAYHREKVMDYFKKIYDNGFLYAKEEEEAFCPICQLFLSDREIIGKCPICGGIAKGDQCDSCLASLDSKDILNKQCKYCNGETITKLNKHLYFKLSAFQEILTNYVNEHKDIWRKNAHNESLKYLNMGLIDRCATRQLEWGIDVPIDGFTDKKIYVWFEAVLGYITTAQKVLEDRDLSFEAFMKDPHLISYYVHGKDNIPFHTIIFPALLKAIDQDYQLPSYIISSEYVNMNDVKMSKSLGNLITSDQLVDQYGNDAVRFALTFNGPEKKDTNFKIDDFIITHNKFLVGILGNFVNRNLSFLSKKFDGLIKEGIIDKSIQAKTLSVYQEVGLQIEQGNLRNALEKVFDYIILGNKYYDENEPWVKVKENLAEFNNITYTCIYMIANMANLIHPFLPETSLKIKQMLSLKEYQWQEEVIKGDLKITSLAILFNRFEEE